MIQWPDKETQKNIYNNVMNDARPDRYFFGMVILSCTVATYGLLSNSTAVVIGAMLIAPLMGPILGGALAVATNSNDLIKVSAKAEALGAVTAVVLAALLTLVLPRAELTSEVLARTTPTILDLVVALASGAAGTFAMCVRPQGATLPGVAIATALMPPLCVVGIGLAKQDFAVMGGAFLLFLANMIAINVAAIAMFEFAGFSSDLCENECDNNISNNFAKYRMTYPIALLIIISLPLAYIMYKTYNQANIEKTIRSSLVESLDMIAPQSSLISLNYTEQDNNFNIDAAIRTTKTIVPENIRQMENLLELRLGKTVVVSADVFLVQKVNDKTNIDNFRELLPKVKEKEVVEVVRSTTPEEVIESTIREKLLLLPGSKLEDYLLEYRKSSGTYVVTARISSSNPIDTKLPLTIQKILEERLKRRVEVKVDVNNDKK
ncbi:TIGR00341 family protein [Dendrosporobacter sp. 1207_IL3150]|uniref:TIGR00341 family protein n=1 Tax=Dendrosporobacter sp. 1207_IL3150 TaxID=3084054 RepID=UPI002FDA9B2B